MALEANQAARRQSRRRTRSVTSATMSSSPVSRVNAANAASSQTRLQRPSSQYNRKPANSAAKGPSTNIRSKDVMVAGTSRKEGSPQRRTAPRASRRAHQYTPSPTKSISTAIYALSIRSAGRKPASMPTAGPTGVENGVAENPHSRHNLCAEMDRVRGIDRIGHRSRYPRNGCSRGKIRRHGEARAREEGRCPVAAKHVVHSGRGPGVDDQRGDKRHQGAGRAAGVWTRGCHQRQHR